MTCAELEILIAGYMDRTLGREQKSAFEDHLAGCAECAGLARDAATAVGFMERAAGVEVPAGLVSRILLEVAGPVKPRWSRRWLGRWLDPVLQPRFAMGLAMTLLSLGLLAPRLDPVKLWTIAEDRLQRAWDRGVKQYDNLALVWEAQTALPAWEEEGK